MIARREFQRRRLGGGKLQCAAQAPECEKWPPRVIAVQRPVRTRGFGDERMQHSGAGDRAHVRDTHSKLEPLQRNVARSRVHDGGAAHRNAP